MSNKKLIVRLIQQDLKHGQLLYGLRKLGLDGSDKHHLQLLDIVFELMQVPQAAEFDWGATYRIYLNQAAAMETESTDRHLKPLAELCYKHLRTLVNCAEMNESRVPDRTGPL